MAKAKKAAKKAAKKNATSFMTATVHAEFRNANPGASDCRVTHNGSNEKKLDRTGSVNYQRVVSGDTIEISCDSPGNSKITVSGVNTAPTEMKANAGVHIADLFMVL